MSTDEIGPGYVIEGSDGQKFTITSGPIAYQGVEGCNDLRCSGIRDKDGIWHCHGYHCAKCGTPSSSQGHRACFPELYES